MARVGAEEGQTQGPRVDLCVSIKTGSGCGILVASHNATDIPLPDPMGAAEACGFIQCWIAENSFLARLIGTGLILLLAWLLIKAADRGLNRSARRVARLRHLDEYQTKVVVGRTRPLSLTIALLVFTVAAIALLGIWGLQTAFTGLLAGAGFAGIVIGLAAADTIGDVIAGFMIFYNNPFDIGDWVEIDGVEGIVEDVALGATSVLTWDNEKVTIPNRVVEGAKVKNFTSGRKLRRRLVVGVEYGSHLGLAMSTLVKLAKDHPDVLSHPEPTAVTQGFGASSVDLVLRFYVEPVRNSVVKVYTDLVHQTHDTFRDMGIGIAFPHMQIVQGQPWRLDGQDDGRTPGADP